jgi:hypothetical protein
METFVSRDTTSVKQTVRLQPKNPRAQRESQKPACVIMTILVRVFRPGASKTFYLPSFPDKEKCLISLQNTSSLFFLAPFLHEKYP